MLTITVETPGRAQNATAEFVVIAKKCKESVPEVPISISALPGDELAWEHVKDLLQAAPLVNGMVFSRAPDDAPGITYREIGTIPRSSELASELGLEAGLAVDPQRARA